MASFILVHGGFHGGWCWSRLAPRLEALGHRVLAPDLKGLGEDETPPGEVTLDLWARQIADLAEAEADPVILVGHSRGGVVISQAAELCPDHIRELVYLSAYLLVDGETMQQAGRRFGTSVGRIVTPDPQRGCFDIDREAARGLFYSGCSEADADWALARLRPEPLAPVSTPVSLSPARFSRVPRSFIACTRDASIPPKAQAAMLERLPCRRLSLDAGHAPMLSHPGELAAALDEIARNPA